MLLVSEPLPAQNTYTAYAYRHCSRSVSYVTTQTSILTVKEFGAYERVSEQLLDVT